MEYVERLKYVSFSPHDCESIYECPYCKKKYYSWNMFNRGIKEGTIFKCDECGKEIKF